MKVFISWSGERSKKVAIALRQWLQDVIQTLEPWLSESDIDKGTRWSTDIAKHLEASRVGVICLTSENLTAPWILFEAGALSKTLEQTYACTYLVELEPTDVEGPLSQFQATRANEEDTLKLIKTINKAQGELSLPEEMIEKAFQKWWPDLEATLQSLEKPGRAKSAKRDQRDLVEEILELTRGQSRMLEELKVTVSPISTNSRTKVIEQEPINPKKLDGSSMLEKIEIELEKRRRPLVLMALQESEAMVFKDGANWILEATFKSPDSFFKRLNESKQIIEEICETNLGISLIVKINHLNSPSDDATNPFA